jgi:hypothetical protein
MTVCIDSRQKNNRVGAPSYGGVTELVKKTQCLKRRQLIESHHPSQQINDMYIDEDVTYIVSIGQSWPAAESTRFLGKCE